MCCGYTAGICGVIGSRCHRRCCRYCGVFVAGIVVVIDVVGCGVC